MTKADWDSLVASVRKVRGEGHVTIAALDRVRSHTSLEEADRLAMECGFSRLAERWRPISVADARAVLRNLLERDMAYGTALMTRQTAEELATACASSAGVSADAFTNGDWERSPVPVNERTYAGPSWNPVTDSTFDGGVVLVGDDTVAIFWFEDED